MGDAQFVRCSACRSLVPGSAKNCRICGAALEVSNHSMQQIARESSGQPAIKANVKFSENRRPNSSVLVTMAVVLLTFLFALGAWLF